MRIRSCGERPAGRPQDGEASTPPSQPELLFAAGNGIDHVLFESRGGDAPLPAVFDKPKSAVERRKPHPILPVDIDRTSTLRRQSLGPRVGHKGAIAETFNPAIASDPEIAFTVFEQGSDRLPGTAFPLIEGGSHSVMQPQQAAGVGA